MRGAILHAPRDIRVEQREDPVTEQPTDAIIRLAATCVCGSDLWPCRGIEPAGGPAPVGHEYAGIVEEAGRGVRTIKPGQFVIGSFFASGNTCQICQAGYQTSCLRRQASCPQPGGQAGAVAWALAADMAVANLRTALA